MKAFDYAIADNEEGIHAALAKGYKLKAAGLDLLDMLKERIVREDKFVSILEVDSLKGIREKENGISIGPLVTLHQLANSELIRTRYKALAQSAGEAATPQIRARATVAGNLLQRPRCWYFRSKEYPCLKKGGATCYAHDGENAFHAIMGEGPCRIVHPSSIAPAFVAADAEIVAMNGKEEERYVAGDFFVYPSMNIYHENKLKDDQLVTEIFLPKTPAKSGYVEFKQKQSFDWPLAACTVAYLDGKWRVVMSHVSQIPERSIAAEEVLGTTADIDNALAEKAADAAVANAEPMSDNAFRVKLARAAVRRSLLMACGKESD